MPESTPTNPPNKGGDHFAGDSTGPHGLDVREPSLELCVANPKVVLMLGNGAGGLMAGTLRAAGSQVLALGDFNEDGHLDVITSIGTATLSFLAGTGTADLAPAGAVSAPRAISEASARQERRRLRRQ